MQDLCHKQQHSTPHEIRQISNRGRFLCAGFRGMLRCWQFRFMTSVTVAGLLTLLCVTAATEPVTSVGKGSLTLKPPMDCSQRKVSCCLGPGQCTGAYLHKASKPATSNIAATTPELQLKGSATLLLPGLYTLLCTCKPRLCYLENKFGGLSICKYLTVVRTILLSCCLTCTHVV